MGGRGSNAIKRKIQGYIKGEIGNIGFVQPIPLAGMNVDVANGVTSRKTLDFIEKQYKKGMGKEQLQILDGDGWVIGAYQGQRHNVAFPPGEITGRVATHNHPQGWGGTFSEADISSLKERPREMRASAAEGVYSMKATGRARAEAFYNALEKAMPRIEQQMHRAALKSFTTRVPKIANPKSRAIVLRRDALNPLHRWYQRNAPKYGFEYTFTRNKDFKI